MRKLWVIEGKGRCAGSVAYVLDETEAAARAALLRECLYFEIDKIYPFTIGVG